MTCSKEEKYEIELRSLESPFTWNMHEIKKTINTDYHAHDDEEFLPLLKFIRNIMIIYVDIKDDQDFNVIKKSLEKSKENFAELKKTSDREISIEAVMYVLKSTEGFVYSKFGMKDELKKVFVEIEDRKLPLDNQKFKSTLIGCKSTAWSLYHRHGALKAEKLIREAIQINPNCHLWYFILAKNLRRLRRDINYKSKPSKEEYDSFKKCYDLSNNPVYGTFVAQMYREKMENENAALMYEKVLKTNPESATILLRLALGLIRLKKYELAKDCLDKVAVENSSSSMYLHYMGIYHMKMEEPNIAVNFLKKASEDDNLPAEKYYVACMVKINKNFDALSYLLQMVEKYNKILPEKELQSILLDIAFLYWKKKNCINMAIKYFWNSIKIDPKSRSLTNYFCEIGLKIPGKNVYNILKKDLLPMTQGKFTNDQSFREEVNSLKKHCDEYFERQSARLQNNFSKLKLKK